MKNNKYPNVFEKVDEEDFFDPEKMKPENEKDPGVRAYLLALEKNPKMFEQHSKKWNLEPDYLIWS